MSANNSDSDSGGSSLHGWTLVNPNGNVERSGDESSSSAEFVKVQNDQVSFHHKERRRSNSPGSFSPPASQSPNDDESGDEKTTSSVVESLDDVDELQSAEELHHARQHQPSTSRRNTPPPLLEQVEEEKPADAAAAAAAADGNKDSSMGDKPDRVEELPAAVGSVALPAPAPRPSESDSDSDFVRLEPSMADEEVAVEEGAVGGVGVVGAGVMEASNSSSVSTGSSISASFRFVQPSNSPAFRMPPPHYQQPRRGSRPVFVADDYDDDDDSVDDRCESDISGVAADESDLSSFAYNLGDIQLEEGKHIYQHQPNNSLNAILTTITLLAFFLGVGIGIGHYMGTSWDVNLRQQYVVRLHSLQDDLLTCLKHQDRLEGLVNMPNEEESKWNAVVSQWKTSYEKLTIEKAALQDDLNNAQGCGNEDILLLKKELNQLYQERDDLVRQVTALRYSKHPANDLQNPDDLKVKVNDLATENADLKSMVGRLRYTKGTTVDVEDKNMLIGTPSVAMPDTRMTDIDVDTGKEEDPVITFVSPMIPSKEVWPVSNAAEQPVVSEAELIAQHDEIQQLLALSEQKPSNNLLLTKQDAVEGDDASVESVEDEIISEDETAVEVSDGATSGVLELESEVGASAVVPPGVSEQEAHAEALPSGVTDQEVYIEAVSPGVPEFMEVVPSGASDGEVNIAASDRVTPGDMMPAPVLPSTPDDDLAGSCDATNGSEVIALKEALQQANSELELERKRVHLWQSLYVAEKMTSTSPPEDNTDFISCLLTAMRRVPSSVDGLWQSLQNLTEPVNKQQVKARQVAVEGVKLLHEFWRNMTEDMSLVDTLQQQWQKVSPSLESPELDQISASLIDAYNKVNEQVRQKWQDFEIYINLHSKGTSSDANAQNASGTGPLSAYINRTKATVTQLSNTIQDTWAKVRNLSEDFVSKHQDKVVQLQEQVVDRVTKIGKSAVQKLDKVQQKVSDFITRDTNTRSTTKNGSQYRHVPQTQQQHQQQQQQQQHQQQQHQQQHQAYPYDQTYHYEEPVSTQGQFEDKPLHKSKQSSNHEEDKKYEEFWHHTGFDPDDLEQEGFFEGNNREWRKHQKRLHKIHSRINRLNEDMLATMDDDDIEDIYEDLEDFEEDIEDEVQPQRLKTWLTCQLRWWKSRFQRKHRSDDLLKACSKQLMHWQLRLLCKTKCPGKKTSCKTFNKFCKTVATNMKPSQPKCHNDNCKHDHHESLKKKNFQETPENTEHFHHATSIAEQPHEVIKQNGQPQHDAQLSPVDEELVNTTSWDTDAMTNWYFQRAQLRENGHQSVDGKWFLNHMETREDTRHDGDWYLHPHPPHDDAYDGTWFLNRMENRDDHRHDGSWYFRPHQSSFDDSADLVFDRASSRERQQSQQKNKDGTKFSKFQKDHQKYHQDQVKAHQEYHKEQMKEHQRYHSNKMREHQRFHKEAQQAHKQFVDDMEQAADHMHQAYRAPEWFSDEREPRRQYGYR